MSSHIGSRWYSPPEIIMVQKHYGKGVDIWAIGCVLFELMAIVMQQESGAVPQKTKSLFRGGYCYPLSPRNQATPEVSKD